MRSIPINRYRFLAILMLGLTALLPGFEAKAQVVVRPSDRFYVRMAGRILNSQKKPVSYATIRNLTNRKAVIADSAGNYSIVLSQYDTLEFRRVGYKTLYYKKSPDRNGNYYQDIYLEEEAFAYDEVTIFRKADRTIRSVAVNPEYNRTDRYQIHIGVRRGTGREAPPDVSNPISFLYDQFSRRGISARKVAELKAQKRLLTLVSIRYNEEYVGSLTGLAGRDLSEFMNFCPLSQSFILSASDYELAAATLNCYRRFMEE